MIDFNYYETKLIDEIFPLIKEVHWKSRVHWYWKGHLPKFVQSVEILDKYVTLNENSIVLDWSPIPFVSYFLFLKFGCTVICKDLESPSWKLNDKVYLKSGKNNLCSDELEKETYDLVVCEEVLLHLPCSLHKALGKLVETTKKDGLLLLSIPYCQSKDVDIHYEFKDYDWRVPTGGKFRTLTKNIIDQLLKPFNLELITRMTVRTSLNGEMDRRLLKKREKLL